MTSCYNGQRVKNMQMDFSAGAGLRLVAVKVEVGKRLNNQWRY